MNLRSGVLWFSALDCGNPGSIHYGITTGSHFSYPHNVTYTCVNGFLPSAPITLHCSNAGVWSAQPPVCRPVTCRELTAPHWGAMNTSNRTLSASVEFSCAAGFLLDGVRTLTCQPSAQWSGTEPRCQPIDCGALADVQHSTVLHVNTTYTGYWRAACDPGYRLVSGNSRRTCISDGSWSGSAPICEGKCMYWDGMGSNFSCVGLSIDTIDVECVSNNGAKRCIFYSKALYYLVKLQTVF